MSASRRFQLSLKRVFDVVASLIVLAMLAPLTLVLILLGLRADGSIFTTTRKRYYGREVPVLRFSTDKHRANISGFILQSNADLIPSLMTVLRGHMSIVGPDFQNEVVIPARFFDAFHNSPFKPGVIGPTMRRHAAKLKPTQIEADYHYVSHWSLGLDVRIIGALLFSKEAWRS
jgi:lipopolysaccharide/colanic/teichoic acid biosynthesis glycosyltransferase